MPRVELHPFYREGVSLRGNLHHRIKLLRFLSGRPKVIVGVSERDARQERVPCGHRYEQLRTAFDWEEEREDSYFQEARQEFAAALIEAVNRNGEDNMQSALQHLVAHPPPACSSLLNLAKERSGDRLPDVLFAQLQEVTVAGVALTRFEANDTAEHGQAGEEAASTFPRFAAAHHYLLSQWNAGKLQARLSIVDSSHAIFMPPSSPCSDAREIGFCHLWFCRDRQQHKLGHWSEYPVPEAHRVRAIVDAADADAQFHLQHLGPVGPRLTVTLPDTELKLQFIPAEQQVEMGGYGSVTWAVPAEAVAWAAAAQHTIFAEPQPPVCFPFAPGAVLGPKCLCPLNLLAETAAGPLAPSLRAGLAETHALLARLNPPSINAAWRSEVTVVASGLAEEDRGRTVTAAAHARACASSEKQNQAMSDIAEELETLLIR